MGVLIWLVIQNKKLKQETLKLRSFIERNNKDIAGLCSAGVSVDSRITDNNEQLLEIEEKVSDFKYKEQEPSSTPSYQLAIQRIHNGANVEELIQHCQLSREEALLLVRMHSDQSQ